MMNTLENVQHFCKVLALHDMKEGTRFYRHRDALSVDARRRLFCPHRVSAGKFCTVYCCYITISVAVNPDLEGLAYLLSYQTKWHKM